jgi:hypothetical protein
VCCFCLNVLQATSESELAVYGYKAQCELLSEHLELLIAGCEARTQSLICEGVSADRQQHSAGTSYLPCIDLHSL